MNRRYGGRLALRGQMDFGELSSAVLVAQNAFDGARQRNPQKSPSQREIDILSLKKDILEGTSEIIFQITIFFKVSISQLASFQERCQKLSHMTYLLMAELLHQLIGSLPVGVSYIPGGCLGFQPSTVWHIPVDGRNPASGGHHGNQIPWIVWPGLPKQLPAMSPNKLLGLAFFSGRDLGHPEARVVYMNCIVRDIVMYSWGW